MAKKIAGTTHMTGMERIAGTIFFLVYLLVMPLLASRLFDFIGTLFGVYLTAAQRNIWYYYVMFVLTLLLFHQFLAHTTSYFFDAFGEAEALDGLRRAQVETMTPIEAMQLLYELKQKLQ